MNSNFVGEFAKVKVEKRGKGRRGGFDEHNSVEKIRAFIRWRGWPMETQKLETIRYKAPLFLQQRGIFFISIYISSSLTLQTAPNSSDRHWKKTENPSCRRWKELAEK